MRIVLFISLFTLGAFSSLQGARWSELDDPSSFGAAIFPHCSEDSCLVVAFDCPHCIELLDRLFQFSLEEHSSGRSLPLLLVDPGSTSKQVNAMVLNYLVSNRMNPSLGREFLLLFDDLLNQGIGEEELRQILEGGYAVDGKDLNASSTMIELHRVLLELSGIKETPSLFRGGNWYVNVNSEEVLRDVEEEVLGIRPFFLRLKSSAYGEAVSQEVYILNRGSTAFSSPILLTQSPDIALHLEEKVIHADENLVGEMSFVSRARPGSMNAGLLRFSSGDSGEVRIPFQVSTPLKEWAILDSVVDLQRLNETKIPLLRFSEDEVVPYKIRISMEGIEGQWIETSIDGLFLLEIRMTEEALNSIQKAGGTSLKKLNMTLIDSNYDAVPLSVYLRFR